MSDWIGLKKAYIIHLLEWGIMTSTQFKLRCQVMCTLLLMSLIQLNTLSLPSQSSCLQLWDSPWPSTCTSPRLTVVCATGSQSSVTHSVVSVWWQLARLLQCISSTPQST